MFLIINTCINSEIKIILAKNERDFKVFALPGSRQQSEKLLSGIDAILRKNKIKLDKIKGIGVVRGPGGFTSVRIGVVCGNTLAYALKVPVCGIKADEITGDSELVKKMVKLLNKKKAGSIVLPYYDREPNITIK